MSPQVSSNSAQPIEGPLIVIKADDLLYREDGTIFGANWLQFIEIAAEKGIKISIGIICHSLENAKLEYVEKIKALHATGQIEFWNHGITHRREPESGQSEFKGVPMHSQLDTLVRAQALAVEKLGFTFTSFGSPYNHFDHNTAAALRAVPELKTWLYGDEQAALLPDQIVLGRSVSLEQPVHYPNFEGVKGEFEQNPNRPYYILQGHPGGWDAARFEQFIQVVDYLQAQNAVFLTPTGLRNRLLDS